MHRSRIPTVPEIRRLVLFLLGRQPSERALAELGQRPLGLSADLILLGTELEGVVRKGVLARAPMPHHREAFAATQPELRWIVDVLGISAESAQALPKVQDWLGLLALLLRDPGLSQRIRGDFAEHARLPALLKVMEEVAAAHPTAEAAAGLALPRPAAPPAPPEASPRTKPTAKRASAKTAGPASRPINPPAPPQPEARITGPWLDPERAEALWRRVLSDPSNPKLRGELYNAFRNDEKVILYLHARLAEVPSGRCAPYESLILLLAARLFLRLFMARSAWEAGNAALAADAAAPGALQASDRNRLLKTLSTAALRTGRVAEATRILKELVREDPLDWEARMALADVVGGTEPARAAELYAIAMHLRPELGPAGRFAVAEFLAANGERVQASRIVLDMMRDGLALSECHLALGNMALSDDDTETWKARIATFFRLQGVAPPALGLEDPAEHLFGIGLSGLPRRDDHPMVSIVTTAWNAAATIESSIRSVLDQTCGNIELLVVDDCSEDGTVGIVAELMARDSRLRLLRNATNIGTYCSKNRAILESRGAFVTLHDSDDWMHPQRIERHLDAMRRGEPAASMSNWVRMEASGRSVLRKGGGGYIHRNPASTFIRREIFDRVGLFDSVRVGADSEMLWRMRHALGPSSVLDIETCLGLGLHHENSLTLSGVTAFDEFRFSPVRLDYAEAWGAWHIRQLGRGEALHVGFPLLQRDFGAPEQIVVTDTPAELEIALPA